MPKRRAPTVVERYLTRHDMTVAELARRAGMSWRAVYRVARGQARPSLRMVLALRRATNGELSLDTLASAA